MAFPQTQIATAQRLIKKFGQEAQWIIPGAFVPDNPDYPGGSGSSSDPEVIEVWVCVLPEDRVGYEWVKYIVDTEIPDGNGYLLLAGGINFEPDITHSIILADGSTVKPSKIDKLAPSGVPILYTVKF